MNPPNLNKTVSGDRDGEGINAELLAAAQSLRLVLHLAALKYGFDLTGSVALEEADAAIAKALTLSDVGGDMASNASPSPLDATRRSPKAGSEPSGLVEP